MGPDADAKGTPLPPLDLAADPSDGLAAALGSLCAALLPLVAHIADLAAATDNTVDHSKLPSKRYGSASKGMNSSNKALECRNSRPRPRYC